MRNPNRRFDLFGFALLSLALGALQLMLDRGESLDWFSSREIVVEAVMAGLFFYMFLVQMFTAEHPFIEPGLFADRNISVGLLMIFAVGVILLATLAILPPFLQQITGYPVLTTGLVLAPRGMGTMVAMVIVGRLIGRADTRLLILFGLGLTAHSLWQMSGFAAFVPIPMIVATGVEQGLGLGFIFVPLSTTTFATLAPQFRTEGTAMFSLMRNIGSIGDRHRAGAEHPVEPRRPGRGDEPVPRCHAPALAARDVELAARGRGGGAEPRGYPPGGDRRLSRRLRGDDVGGAAGDAAASSDEAPRETPCRAGPRLTAPPKSTLLQVNPAGPGR